MEDINKNSKACSSIHSNDSNNTVLKKIEILFGKQEQEKQKVEQKVEQKNEQEQE
jgi:Zn-finger protein